MWGYAATGAAAGWAGWNTTLVAGPFAGAAVVGAITGAGNALTGGASIGEAIGQGIVGGATGMLGGMLAGPVSGVISGKLSSVIGSTASGIVANITTSAAVGGAFGAGMSVMNGGSPWQGFVSGMRMGAITGAISSAVPAAINGMKKPKPSVPKEVEVETINQKTEVKTELADPPEINRSESSITGRNSVWGMEPMKGGFAVEKMTIDDTYKGWEHLKYAKTIDAVTRNGEGAVVSIKSTGFTKVSGRLNIYDNIKQLGTDTKFANYGTKILHVVTPPNYNITNIAQIRARCASNNIEFKWTYIK